MNLSLSGRPGLKCPDDMDDILSLPSSNSNAWPEPAILTSGCRRVTAANHLADICAADESGLLQEVDSTIGSDDVNGHDLFTTGKVVDRWEPGTVPLDPLPGIIRIEPLLSTFVDSVIGAAS